MFISVLGKKLLFVICNDEQSVAAPKELIFSNS